MSDRASAGGSGPRVDRATSWGEIEAWTRPPVGELAPVDSAEAYRRARQLLHECSSPDGFLAASTPTANYRRVWTRDGVIIGLGALMTGDPELKGTFGRTLEFIAAHQGPQGEIPSNVDGATGRISYGGTTGRVDSDLWFIIGCGEYWRATGDTAFLRRMRPVLDRVLFLLRAWEFNNRGLLFVPPAGDWADEYIESGYVLCDELLYLQAQRALAEIHRHLDGAPDHDLEGRAGRLHRLIADNYWFYGVEHEPAEVYHETLYAKGRAAPRCNSPYWVPFFSPHGYGYRFDALANVLVSLVGVASEDRREHVDRFIGELVRDGPALLPAFRPVIKPLDEEWEHLQVNYSNKFRNEPYEYQNGGLWPMITGFYVADLARRGRTAEAAGFLDGIHRANALPMEGEPWSFPEFVHGWKRTAGGTRHQGWSAAAALIGHHALEGAPVFRIGPAAGAD